MGTLLATRNITFTAGTPSCITEGGTCSIDGDCCAGLTCKNSICTKGGGGGAIAGLVLIAVILGGAYILSKKGD
jgi:hypothetical protein